METENVQQQTVAGLRRGDWIGTCYGGVGQIERRGVVKMGKHEVKGFVVRMYIPRQCQDFVPEEDAVILGGDKG